MSIAAINWALNSVEAVTAAEKAVLIALADRADQEHCCFPSYDDICKRSCATRNTVSRAIARFEELGLLERQKRFGKSTVYRLRVTSSTEIHTTVNASSTEMRTTVDEGFDVFWKSYPRKANKKTASLAWKALSKKDKKAAMSGLANYAFSNEEKYRPHAATWLRQRRWEDEEQQVENTGVYEI